MIFSKAYFKVESEDAKARLKKQAGRSGPTGNVVVITPQMAGVKKAVSPFVTPRAPARRSRIAPRVTPEIKEEVKTEPNATQLDASHMEAYWQYVNSPNEESNLDLLSNDTKTIPQSVSLVVS